ncbi:hypothetical protein ACKFKF_29780 [Phormidesmis sp. 146-12]
MHPDRLISGALAGGILLAAASAQAIPFRDAAGNIHFQDAGQTPGLSLQASNGDLKRNLVANFCGILPVTNPPAPGVMPASITVAGTTIDTTTLPVQAVPTCINNVLSEPRAADFKSATGAVYLVGRTPGIRYETTYPGIPAPGSVSVNGCGYGRISNTVARPAPTTFVFGGTTYTTVDLNLQIPNICITTGGVPTRYAPAP